MMYPDKFITDSDTSVTLIDVNVVTDKEKDHADKLFKSIIKEVR